MDSSLHFDQDDLAQPITNTSVSAMLDTIVDDPLYSPSNANSSSSEPTQQQTTPTLSIVDDSHSNTKTEGDEQTKVPVSPRMVLLKHTLEEIQKNTAKALELLNEEADSLGMPPSALSQAISHLTMPAMISPVITPALSGQQSPLEDGQTIIEGVFDGFQMVGPDGKQYSVPANYASKSKLVEGDVMKLTITKQGSFMYKQIGPVIRQRVVTTLVQDPATNEFVVVAGDRQWRILTASVTFFKGVPGDEVVVLVPQTGTTKWAAVENIIKKFQ